MNVSAISDLPSLPQMRTGQSGESCVSLVIPVHNAAITLTSTLCSVIQQSYVVWEAIIVDDGSTDRTRAIANDWAQRDPRFRVLHQDNRGVSAARNRGLQEARNRYVLFLDGDDRIAPVHIERMLEKLSSDPGLDAVHCGWQDILPSGTAGGTHFGAGEGDLFNYFACHCHFAVHACVLRRDLALAVGGFDISLSTCEDWDFFQRVARTGAQFARLPEVLAYYHRREDSASRDGLRLVTDSLVVLNRGHGPDPRLRIASEAHVRGAPPAGRNRALYDLIIYWAAQEIGSGRDALNLLDIEDLAPLPDLGPAAVSEIFQVQIPMAANRQEKDWPYLWTQVSAPLTAFLAQLEAKARAPRLAFIALRHLEENILSADLSDTPLHRGTTYRLSSDLAKPVRDIRLPTQTDRVICRLFLKGELFRVVELPAPGALAGRKIVEAAAEGRARLLFRRAMTPTRSVAFGLRMLRGLLRRQTLGFMRDAITAKNKDRSAAAQRLKQEVVLTAKAKLLEVFAPHPQRAASEANRRWHNRVHFAIATGRARARKETRTKGRMGVTPRNDNWWERLFALPDPCAYESEYEVVKREQILAFLPAKKIANALELGCAEGHFTLRLAPHVGRLTAVDISGRALARAQARCGDHRNIAFRRVDLDTDGIPGSFDLIVGTEIFYYLRDLPRSVRHIVAKLRPGGFLLTAHSRVLIDDPQHAGFAWEQPCGVETVASTIAAQPGIALLRELRTPLYSVLLYQRLAPGQKQEQPEIEESDRMGKMTPAAYELARFPDDPSGRISRQVSPTPKPRPNGSGPRLTDEVPILMYNRVATDGPLALAPYRVAPDLFAAQMDALYRAGYHTIHLQEWFKALMP